MLKYVNKIKGDEKMLIFLLLFEIAIIFIIVLCHMMLEKKYKEIEKSIQIYTSKRAYRTKQSVAFIADILDRHEKYVNEEDQVTDLYSMIKSSLLKEYIGKFTFIGVNNVANKAKYIMWGIIILEMAIGFINNINTSLEGIIVIISSILLAIGVEIFIIVKALEEKKEAMIVLVEDYILNTYPLQTNNKTKVSNNKDERMLEEGQAKELILLKKAQKKDFDTKPIKNCNKKKQEKEISVPQVKSKERLTEKDIAMFINHLSD